MNLFYCANETRSRAAVLVVVLVMMGLRPASAGELHIYEHNHSIVDWFIVGDNITVTYATPRSGLEESGVRSGTVLFKGYYEGERIEGTAYAFKAGCAPAPYDVIGSQDNAGNIILRGPGPLRGKVGCEVIGYSAKSPHAKLKFIYSATHH